MGMLLYISFLTDPEGAQRFQNKEEIGRFSARVFGAHGFIELWPAVSHERQADLLAVRLGFQLQLRSPDADRRVECFGGFRALTPSGHGYVHLGISPKEAGYPDKDMGEFLLQCVLPLCRSTGCLIGVASWRDHVSPERFLEALKNHSLPDYADGYYLTRPFVDRIGLETIRSVYQEMVRESQAELRGAGLLSEATAEEIMASEEPTLLPRPILREGSDGSILLYGRLSISMGERLGLHAPVG